MAEDDVYAIFVDMMGFASAVEALPKKSFPKIQEQLLGDNMMTFMSDLSEVFRFKYLTFHQVLNEHVNHCRKFFQAFIEFSDSAYLITTEEVIALAVSIRVIRDCLKKNVPVRIGVGRGTFARLPFIVSNDPFGLVKVEAPFLGASIVNAYRAHDHGPKGFRILVHPSATNDDPHGRWQYIRLNEIELHEHCAQEINFLQNKFDYHAFGKLLGEMQQDVSDVKALKHYKATYDAIERMEALLSRREDIESGYDVG